MKKFEQMKKLTIADFILGLEEKYGYEDVDSVLLDWEEIRHHIRMADGDTCVDGK